MRATLVNHRYLPFRGGSELYTQKLAEWLVTRGVETSVLTTNASDLEYFWDSSRQAVEAPPRELINGVSVERLPVRHPALSNVIFPATRRAMGEAARIVPMAEPFRRLAKALPSIPGLTERLLEEPCPDLIIGTNLGLEGLAITAQEAAKRIGAPFVLASFAHLGDGPASVARRYVSMPHHRELVQRADLLIALTEMEAAFLESIGASPARIVVAGAGVDRPECRDASDIVQSTSKDCLFTILSIGALARDKGAEQVVEASRMLWNGGFRHRLVLVGPELNAFSNWIEATAAGDSHWIERRGVVSEAVKQELLSKADVFVLPSRTESFGIVFLEAWAQRTPVIGAAVGAVTEVIDDEVNGILVPFGDAPALARAIQRIRSDPDFGSRLGNAGYAKVEETFTWDHVLGRIECGIRDALGIELR